MQNSDNVEEAHDNIQMPHHPDQPQDTISFDESGSTAKYLHAKGPDIILMVEDLCGDRNGSSSFGDSSSSPSKV